MSAVAVITFPKQRSRSSGSVTERKYRDDPEVGLMLRVREGDTAAFAELVDRYWMRVFGRFCRRLGDRQEAEDLTQDVFLRLYRARERYEPRARFATWLFHITQNVARNALRSRRRRPCTRLTSTAVGPGGPIDQDAFVEGLLFDRGGAPSEPLERAELAGKVRSAVSELGERQRTAVELHQFQDRTYAEVAAEMDMSPEAAKSLLYRARNQLRVNLGALMEV
jgi:RNA polymerase sigma-70 factor (ECF subfamily)